MAAPKGRHVKAYQEWLGLAHRRADTGNTGEEMNDGLRQPASPPDQDGKQPGNKGALMVSSEGVGTMRNRHVGWYRAGIEGADACPATRIVQRTAKAWEVK